MNPFFEHAVTQAIDKVEGPLLALVGAWLLNKARSFKKIPEKRSRPIIKLNRAGLFKKSKTVPREQELEPNFAAIFAYQAAPKRPLIRNIGYAPFSRSGAGPVGFLKNSQPVEIQWNA